MTNKLARRLTLALGLAFAASAAQAQDAPPSSGVDYGAPVREGAAAPESRRERRERRADIAPYLEVAQGISTEFGGDTLTYTTLAAGVDGSVQTRRVTAVLSYRYDRLVEWNGNAGDTDTHSGIAAISAQVVPGAVNIEAGALATRTGGEGRAAGVTDRDESVEVYSAYAGPTLATHAGPVAINASYRLGYVAIDDDSVAGGPREDYDDAVAHSATASVGIAPGRSPVGVTVGAGYARTDSGGEFDHQFEGAYVRGDVVVPVSPTLAFTAGVGYEDIQASQRDLVRDANGVPVLDVNGRPSADPAAPPGADIPGNAPSAPRHRASAASTAESHSARVISSRRFARQMGSGLPVIPGQNSGRGLLSKDHTAPALPDRTRPFTDRPI